MLRIHRLRIAKPIFIQLGMALQLHGRTDFKNHGVIPHGREKLHVALEEGKLLSGGKIEAHASMLHAGATIYDALTEPFPAMREQAIGGRDLRGEAIGIYLDLALGNRKNKALVCIFFIHVSKGGFYDLLRRIGKRTKNDRRAALLDREAGERFFCHFGRVFYFSSKGNGFFSKLHVAIGQKLFHRDLSSFLLVLL